METGNIAAKAAQFMSLFEGFANAYGTYDGLVPSDAKGGKLEIKATAKTIRENIDIALWVDHLRGKMPLGVIPIRGNNTCLWGVIDIDSYDLQPIDIIKKIAADKLPLVACRSKSGGIHLFLFLKNPLEASIVQMRLRDMAAALGFGMSEVFPKQVSINWDRGDLGSWLNMPYFDGDLTNRYAYSETGLALTMDQFLILAKSRQIDGTDLEERSFRKKPEKDPDWGDGPPCMQHLAAVGYPEGSRNKGLFALGIFAQKKYGSDWEIKLEKWNHTLFEPPLPASEFLGVVKSLRNKQYNYTCKEYPLAQHCNSALCRTRKFGVGGEDDYPQVAGLSVLESDPPLWFLDVEGKRIELTTEQLRNYQLFHMMCMEKLYVCFRNMKQDEWLRIVSEAMRDAVRIEAPREVGTIGRFEELVDQFVNNRHRATQQDQIFLGRPWYDEDKDRHYFRLRDLEEFLHLSNFKNYQRSQITERIQQMRGGKHFFNIQGQGVNVWWIPGKSAPIPLIPLPRTEEKPF